MATDSQEQGGIKPEMNEKEAEMLLSLIKHMKTTPDVDWEGFRKANGYKNVEVAKKRFYQVKKRLGIMDNSTVCSQARGSKVTGKVKKSRSPKKGKKLVKESVETDHDPEEEESVIVH